MSVDLKFSLDDGHPAKRVEEIKIRADLDWGKAIQHKKDVLTLCPGAMTGLLPGDVTKLTYTFWIRYFGDIVKNLNAMGRICADPAIFVKVECEELEEGRVLVYEILKKLDAVIETVREKNA